MQAHDKTLSEKAEEIKQLKATIQKGALFEGADVEAGMDGVIEGNNMLQGAKGIQDKTQESLDRTKQMIQESKDVGTTTLGKLQEQNEQIERIDGHIDQTLEHLERADLLIKNFSKRMAQDKFILCCACVNICLLVGVILWAVLKDSGGNNNSTNGPETINVG